MVSHSKLIETRTQEIAASLLEKVSLDSADDSSLNKWTREILLWCLQNPEVKGRILRFVDVFPTLQTDKAITEHIRDYFPSSETRLPFALRGGSLFTKAPFTSRTVANVTRHMITDIAKQFICGETIEEAKKSLARLESYNLTASLDILGEKALSHKEADRYMAQYQNLIQSLPRNSNISVKLSSLSPHFNPGRFEETCQDVFFRLLPICEQAREKGTFINIDVEEFTVRDLTLEIVKRLVSHKKMKGWPQVGTVFQSYLKDSHDKAVEFLAWLKENHQPMTLRLVKGAYWDSELAHAQSQGWPIPVLEGKEKTDSQFNKIAALFMESRDLIRVGIASHNIPNVAYALALQERSTFSKDSMEFQFLYGMAANLKKTLANQGQKVRVYSPYGPLIPGMAYLVRRILENTSNESFLQIDAIEGIKVQTNGKSQLASSKNKNGHISFSNEPISDFSKSEVRQSFNQAIKTVSQKLGAVYPIVINGEKKETGQVIPSLNPSDPEQIIGKVSQAKWEHIEEAISIAQKNQPNWDLSSIEHRSQCLRQAADIMRERRVHLAAWEIYETGKTSAEADADVAEAIDFLNFYSEALPQLSTLDTLAQAPGEKNSTYFHGRGIAAIISPWNFPLAILTGMSSAALVAGNAVLIKPAQTSAVVASLLVDIYLEAGIPPSVIAFVPGPGAEVGGALVRHPDVDLIAFTGSQDVGLSINREAGHTQKGQKNVKKVILEMGGKNAIIVDDDADLDEALQGVLASAFGYQGQKCSACSRVIVLDSIYKKFTDRLVQATDALVTTEPTEHHSDLGPVIDLEAHKKITRIIEEGKKEARLLFQGQILSRKKSGYFIPPTIFSEAPLEGILCQEEIFGPVLTLIRVHSFDEAIRAANETDYALTAGLYSRNLKNIEEAKRRLYVGNIYINRKITGALVGRQPFGGFKMSGTGSKAGGIEYLNHFLVQTTISENTLRHGFPL